MTNRKYRHCFGTLGVILALCILPWSSPSPAWANGLMEAAPLELRHIMQELGRNMQRITDAISREDWVRVAELAPKVATHPEPPLAEKMRILAYLGDKAITFRSFDEEVHEAALVMEEAAQRGGGMAVIQSFARVQEGCLGCHQAFRKPFVEHFYNPR